MRERTGANGEPVVVVTPGPQGYRTFFTSRGDDTEAEPPESGRGNGDPASLTVLASDTFPKTYTAQWSYMEPVHVHDGQLTWGDPVEFGREDYFSIAVIGPASTVEVASPANTGDVNLVAMAGYNAIVPAPAGDGTHTLLTKSPVPCGLDDNGYWDCDLKTGAITPAPVAELGKAEWHLLDVPFKSYFVRNVSMNNPLGVFDIDTYMAEWVSPDWTWELEVIKKTAPSNDVDVAAWVYLFRENST